MERRVALYARVSTDKNQTTENQLLALHEVASRSGWTVVATSIDEGISGAKGREKRPGYDALLKAISRREVDMVAAWSVDRLGRSLQDLVSFLSELKSCKTDLFLHQQALDTSSPSGRLLFSLIAVFAEFERSMIVARVKSGLDRVRANGTRLGRPPLPKDRVEKIKACLAAGKGVRETARVTGAGTASVHRIKATMMAQQQPHDHTHVAA